MIQHLHKEVRLTSEDVIIVHSSTPALVFFTNDENYSLYLEDKDFDYFGEESKHFPFRIRAPRPGKWHLVIETIPPGQAAQIHLQIEKSEN